jgi:hypothetical protein
MFATMNDLESFRPMFGQNQEIIEKLNEIVTKFIVRINFFNHVRTLIMEHYTVEGNINKGIAHNYIREINSFVAEAIIETRMISENTYHITSKILIYVIKKYNHNLFV